MLKLEVQLDNIDYDSLFNSYFGRIKEMQAESDEPAAGLMSRVPDAMAHQIWNGLSSEQKEKIAAGLLKSAAKRYERKALDKLEEQDVRMTVKKLDVEVI